MTQQFHAEDLFAEIHQGGRLSERLERARELFNRQGGAPIDRIGCILFDEATGRLRTYLAVPSSEDPSRNQQIPLGRVESLVALAEPGRTRVINDLDLFACDSEPGWDIRELGMASSYALPIFAEGQLRGFLFLNSRQKDFFQTPTLERVSPFAHLLIQMILDFQLRLKMLVASLRINIDRTQDREQETPNHLERMARFARLIAEELVCQGQASLDDEELEQIYRFAPLHDIGKLAIPTQILQKAGQLDAREWSVVKEHPGAGRAFIDQLVTQVGSSALPDIELLQQIVELHHEKLDGSGYPHGLKGEQIPIAARIVGVCDIFDALTSKRPFKRPWKNEEALLELERLVRQKHVDANCVAALETRLEEVEQVQQLFADH